MKQRPWPIILLAFLHFIAPFGNLFFNYYYSKLNLWDFLEAFFYIKNLKINFIILIAPFFAGLAIYACKKWSYITYLFLMFLMLLFSTYSWVVTPDPISIWIYLTIVFLNIIVVTYFLIPAVRIIYFDPKLRWWEAKPRYILDTYAACRFNDESTRGQIKNISEGGLFIKMDSTIADATPVQIEFQYQGMDLTLSGHIIIHEKIKELGVAVKFNSTPDTLKKLISLLKEEGKLINARLPGPEDSFKFWLRKLFYSGKGIVPDIQKK